MFISLVSYGSDSDEADSEVAYITLWTVALMGIALIQTTERISKIANGVVHSCIEHDAKS
jgi:ABC-type antimicrobial peptide transport system permease subunit